ncbi:hypothetical protein DFH27DRAFT_612544 [Peziza echinospora]|nr:hypothetical protein DFH27DRAFT_612544 [Peziza echinospora]
MGIPNLYSTLRPYSKPITFSKPLFDVASTRDEDPSPTGKNPLYPGDRNLYIDGPALAHHIYYMSLSDNYYDSLGRVRRNPFDAVVEYEDFVREVIGFLEKLERCGFIIRAIYFDGYLPAFKRPTRLTRLDVSLHKLLAYHGNHPTHIPSLNSAYRNASESSKIGKASTKHLTNLPSPPFIVSTALSSLIKSKKWGSLVKTVPGEADSWCATDALRNGGIALSGDTDLLLYGSVVDETEEEAGAELDPQWGVLMLRDFAFSDHIGVSTESGEVDQVVAKGLIFRPHELNNILFGGRSRESTPTPLRTSSSFQNKTASVKKSKKKKTKAAPTLEKPVTLKPTQRPSSLVNLAFQLQHEPVSGLSRLKQLVKAASLSASITARERAFQAEYGLVPVSVKPCRTGPVNAFDRLELQLQRLDPRISEIVYQLPCMNMRVHPPSSPQLRSVVETESGTVEICEVDSFLPFLYEDPTRSSAWDVGVEIRHIAYQLLESYQNHFSKKSGETRKYQLRVQEFIRRGRRMRGVIVGEEIDGKAIIEGEESSKDALTALMEYMESWKEKPTEKVAKRGRSCSCSKNWWVEMVLELVVREYTIKGKEPPTMAELGVIVHILSQGVDTDTSDTRDAQKPKSLPEAKSSSTSPVSQNAKSGTPPSWTWSLIHLFSQVQAGVYSLWMLKQLMVFALAIEEDDPASKRDSGEVRALAELMENVPPVERVIAGKRFLGGFSWHKAAIEGQACEECGRVTGGAIATNVAARWKEWEAKCEEQIEDEPATTSGSPEGEGEEDGDSEEEEKVDRGSWGGMDTDF